MSAMTTRLVHEMTYDAPADKVAAMLRDPKFREAVCDAQTATKKSVSITENGGGMEVTIDQWLPTEGVPAFATKIVGETTNVVQTEQWSDAFHGDITVAIPGKPGEMKGTATITETDGVTTEVVDLEIKVKIPVIGGKLEGLIAGILKSALKAENRTGRTWLA
jgi:hypothetical protein